MLGIESHCEEAKLAYIIRDHDRDKFEDRKAFIADCVKKINEKYGEGTCEAEIYDQYYNMKEKIDPNMHVIDIVLRAMQENGVPPRVEPIRGGTDGAQLSFKGLPCPNIFAGGVNFHGPHEFVSIQGNGESSTDHREDCRNHSRIQRLSFVSIIIIYNPGKHEC